MSEHEDILRWWTITLIAVLDGFTMASEAIVRVGEKKNPVEVLMEDMRGMMGGYTPDQKWLLARQLALLSGLAVRVEPSS